jgi:hypothetical protein
MLTETQARVLYTVLRQSSAPRVGYRQFIEAVAELREIGKGEHCRDCIDLGTVASPHGGMVCVRHA